MNLHEQLKAFIKKENLFHTGDKLLLAVSGGLDSSVLTHLLHVAGYDIELMHVNFHLRGEESNRDEEFVRSLAKKYNVPLHNTRFNTQEFAEKEKLSTQVAARELRYQWFHEIRSQVIDRKAWIVTAHHLDDNLETAFMNWVKGTGIHGLRGMLPSQNAIVRPLLFARRGKLEEYAKQHQLDWVEDSSNQEDNYTRNYLRHQVMPLLEKNPSANAGKPRRQS
ncbi:MAG: tRNA lysidine(34) synthetase TilS [Chitinophagaceae bacterium]|nr:tRNA lysidine(34) synthetase TilS [Chitinophagaceae bacterium]